MVIDMLTANIKQKVRQNISAILWVRSLSGSYIRSNTRIKCHYTCRNSCKNDRRRLEHEDYSHAPSCVRKYACTSLSVHTFGQKMVAQARNVASVKVKATPHFDFAFACYWTVQTQAFNEDKSNWIEPLGSPVDGGSWDPCNVSTFLPDCTSPQKTSVFVAIAMRNLVSQIVNLPINADTLDWRTQLVIWANMQESS